MKAHIAVVGIIVLICGAPAFAQTNTTTNAVETTAMAPSPPTASAGLFNDWLRQQSDEFKKWDIGGQIRLRYEIHENFAVPGRAGAVDFGHNGVDNDNDYFLTREKIHLGYTPIDWATGFVEGRHSSAAGDERNPSPDRDSMDLHQAYLKLGSTNHFPVSVKVGRQQLVYGDERLIGASDWANTERTFDAAKVRYEIPDLWVDGFVGHVVMVQDGHFNEPNEDDFLSGVYASTRTIIPKQETEAYFIARNVSSNSPNTIGPGLPPVLTGASPRDIYTIGFRMKSLPGEFGGWDYETEMAGQFGRFQFSPTSPSLSQEAYAAHVAGGYTWTNAWGKPRAGLEYNFASGDSNPNDGKHETFDNIFPTNHKFYGYMDFFSWQNMHDFRLATSVNPLTKLLLTLDCHAFWLADTHDFFYQVNGAPRNSGGYGIKPAAGSYVGSELDFIATWKVKSYANAQAGYGHFFVGDYVKNSLAASGGAVDADFLYLQLTFNF